MGWATFLCYIHQYCFDLVSSGLIVDLVGSYFGRQPCPFPHASQYWVWEKEEAGVQEHFTWTVGLDRWAVFSCRDLDEEMTCREFASRSHRGFCMSTAWTDGKSTMLKLKTNTRSFDYRQSGRPDRLWCRQWIPREIGSQDLKENIHLSVTLRKPDRRGPLGQPCRTHFQS